MITIDKINPQRVYEVEIRPWGMYEVLLNSPECKVKRITVDPGQKLSYQYHFHRSENWTVVKGELTIILDDEKIFRKVGESVKIPQGAKHRAWNETDEIVQFIEVQTGAYFEEDDIVRIEDDYNRE
jgi:mannose-6-phosphate isomerase